MQIAWLAQSCCCRLLSTDFAFYSFVDPLLAEAIAIHSGHFYCYRCVYVYVLVCV